MNKIRFATPDISSLESLKVKDAINSRWLTTGEVVHEFERKVAELSGCHRAVAFDSCSGALEMSLRVLGIGPGDEVITTPFTYSATAEVIRNVGAKIVFVDLDGSSFEMDYQKVSEAITEHTKAVIPVDYGGKLCNYDALIGASLSRMAIFRPANELQESLGRVAIVADAAHSFTATQGKLTSGQFADFTCFSFHVLKNITTGGEGGAVAWRDFYGVDNDNIELTLRLLGDHGQTTRDKSNGWEYDIVLFGYNSIMTNLDAAMGLAQIERLPELTAKRKEITNRYGRLFEGIPMGGPIPALSHFGGGEYMSSMYLYPVILQHAGRKLTEKERNDVYWKLHDVGIPCNVHYKPLPMMSVYQKAGFDIVDYPNAYGAFESLLTIPYHTELKEDEQIRIVEEIEKAVRM